MYKGKRIGVISLGCSKNRVNSEQMMFLLSRAGYIITGDVYDVDIALVNTCGFIESAKIEACDTVLELIAGKNECRIGKIIVAGCFPQRYKESVSEKLPGVDAFVGTGSFDDIVDVVEKLIDEQSSGQYPCHYFGDINAPVSEVSRILSTSPFWAYLKIAEGCDNKCAYCCIPEIRGRFRSRVFENIVCEAKKLADAGVAEIILTAQDLTMYGVDIYGKHRLSELLVELNKIEKLRWIRLHYLYPDEIDDELIDVIAKSDKILKYLDIPIQHINTSILKRMHRRGSGADIRELFVRLRERIEGVVLRTSLITGLPGEGDDEFNELYCFLREMKIERVGVFAYSPEEGTEAALMDRPSKEVAEFRAEKIFELQADIMREWNESRIGSCVEVLVEDLSAELGNDNYLLARSYAESPEVDGYIFVKESESLRKRKRNNKRTDEPSTCLVSCMITGIVDGELVGEII